MSDVSADQLGLVENTKNENGDIVFVSGVNFPLTAKMRIDLAMTQIQKYTALADFDDDADALRKQWGAYYKAIKTLYAEEEFEDLFNVALPDQA